ncbi:hypothetical protein GIB67_012529 [Kingdonia uniflora]|uniref:Mon2/Sec7/BIG1-like HUS domain-containing protein n=1 Tax=Kingdonia uniflora TaxID=39325 RepID=A0A7J7N5A5_9MAGN|nr:hypothetical protein GIB67_012529 [Kingdonia uniflora]
MGRPKMDSGINAIEEEPEEFDSTSNTSALACMINSEVGAVLAIMRRNVRWGGRFMAVNPVLYLQPFLDVGRFDETGAPIAGVILSLVYKILTLYVIDLNTVNVEETMHLVVDVVTSCRFEVTDPASEEVVLMKILQFIKREPRVSSFTMHELVRCIFSRLPDIVEGEVPLANGVASSSKPEVRDYSFGSTQLGNGNSFVEYNGQRPSVGIASTASMGNMMNGTIGVSPNDLQLMTKPYGVPCMMEIFHFLCSLLNIVEHIGIGPRSNTLTFDEDVPLFTLSLINSAIELGGPSICQHPKLLALIQDELFRNLMLFGLSMSSLLLSMVCSIVLNLYHHLRMELKLQLEAFFSCVVLRLAQSRHGASYRQQEVAVEALVDFCRQKTFMVEMHANLDCDITCNNVFEDLSNLLSKSAFPVNCPLSTIHILALDGLITVIQGMAERIGNGSAVSEQVPFNFEEYIPFWTVKCELW